MRAYEYRISLGIGAAALDATQDYRPAPRDGDAVWPPRERAYGGSGENERQRWLALLGLGAARLIVPVSLLLVLLGAVYLYADDLLPVAGLPVRIRDAGLVRSDLILPGAWMCLNLINRRYGPDYALSQLVAATVLALVLMLFNPGGIDQWVATVPPLASRAGFSFAGALLIANFVGIVFFDAARGTRWWTAPLAASFVVSALFSAIYYPAALAGVEADWMFSALVHFIVFFGMSVLLLLPYCLLRPTMRPINGMNGF